MEPAELLRYVVAVLEGLGARYLVTGSTATIFYGEPRFTADIDIVADLRTEHVSGLLRAFEGEGFYLDDESVRRAIASRAQFNIIHPASGLKVDIIIPKLDDFDESRMSRARRIQPGPGYEASFASPEDVILKKLVFFREGGSDKHLRDIAGVAKISGDTLDWTYLAVWADRLAVADLWQVVLERLGR
jgi:hypothetical protein